MMIIINIDIIISSSSREVAVVVEPLSPPRATRRMRPAPPIAPLEAPLVHDSVSLYVYTYVWVYV